MVNRREEGKLRTDLLQRDVVEEILSRILKYYNEGKSLDKETINRIKREVAKKYRLIKYPRDSDILKLLPVELKNKLREQLRLKPVRTISGVAIVAVMTKPMPCPGKCIYCPGGIDSSFPTPKSYTGHEPASRRAMQYNYDPFLQVRYRIKQLEEIGHEPQKIEVIIMGGTFLALPKSYRDYFIKGIYEGLLGQKFPNKSLEELQLLLETSKYRLVGLTIETRPDYCYEYHVDEMLRYGATRVEIGVQSTDDEILKAIKRGHGTEEIKRAFRVAKDAGYKIVAHVMPNLPFSDPKRDLKSLLKLIEDPDYRPDMLKIYPTAVIEGTELYEMWKKGDYQPYPQEKLIEVLSEFKKRIPPWIRIQRVQRDIPLYKISAGYSVGNLRQVVLNYMNSRGYVCRCIRCREVGHVHAKKNILPKLNEIKLVIRRYYASSGEEVFISFEDVKKDILIGFLRLRKPSEMAHRPEIDQNTTIVRELHIFGPQLPLHEKDENKWQHRGFGSKLLEVAERISREEYDAKKILVISGIGVREYYRRLGYKKIGPYMGKKL